jgi:hypothetical protein
MQNVKIGAAMGMLTGVLAGVPVGVPSCPTGWCPGCCRP